MDHNLSSRALISSLHDTQRFPLPSWERAREGEPGAKATFSLSPVSSPIKGEEKNHSRRVLPCD